ncbi:hypothetical protein PIB30_061659 [Stylosanthes scabra]|uniref:Uncharacterized protein n=1 Tax=Stylosanthes scabra TaxID=79078 RepID=A0ABU6SLC7_9FABA|nr:hypothetical protein [Stylosanthes scabra]
MVAPSCALPYAYRLTSLVATSLLFRGGNPTRTRGYPTRPYPVGAGNYPPRCGAGSGRGGFSSGAGRVLGVPAPTCPGRGAGRVCIYENRAGRGRVGQKPFPTRPIANPTSIDVGSSSSSGFCVAVVAITERVMALADEAIAE